MAGSHRFGFSLASSYFALEWDRRIYPIPLFFNMERDLIPVASVAAGSGSVCGDKAPFPLPSPRSGWQLASTQ